jgi:hypothetical protein
LVRLPAEPLASGGKIVGYSFGSFLRFVVFDFKEIHFLYLHFLGGAGFPAPCCLHIPPH